MRRLPPEAYSNCASTGAALSADQINSAVASLLSLLNDAATDINEQVDAFEQRFRPAVSQWVQERATALGVVAAINAELAIPIFAAQDEERIHIPVQPTALRVKDEAATPQDAEAQWVPRD